METIIALCLIIIIMLLFQDKLILYKKADKNEIEEKEQDFTKIIGQTKSVSRNSSPKSATEDHIKESRKNPDNFEVQYDENENIDAEIQQEESEENFSNTPDWDQEEEELKGEAEFNNYNGLAQGVTFEELGTAGMLLQKDILDASQKQTAADIVQKIHGTELYDLLVNSIEDASRKISELLYNIILTETKTDSSVLLPKNNYKDFDIQDFT
ncbi:conjugal transfer protein TraD [Elizabethkingia anophelis]|uniref:conjugal transfer protein TraD n=1 Tax=Elizabethkingia anophelis TaxID=1117645 RepID=UPI003462FEC2